MSETRKSVRDGGTAVRSSGEGSARIEQEVEPESHSLSFEELLVPPDAEYSPVLSVVMPTMNEEEGIDTCLDWIEEAIVDLQLPAEIIVSDASTDRTPEIARERGAIVVEPDRPGYGYAYRYAFRHARGEYVVMGDADTTYDFSEIPRLLEHLQAEDADIIMGSRLDGEIKPGAMPALHQYVGNPLLTKFLNTFYDAGVSDAHSGFRIIRRDALGVMGLESDGMEFASEMVMQAGANSLDIVEVPITYHEREGEATLESFRDGWRHVRFMLTNAPGYLFSVPAGGFISVGVTMLLLSLLGAQSFGVFFGLHTTIIGSLLVIVGFQVGSLVLFSAVATDPIQAPSNGVTRWIRDTVRLEHGVAMGLVLFAGGTAYLTAVLAWWLTSGGSLAPLVVPNLIAFTAVVIGIQAVFTAFFMSMILDGGSE